MHESKRECMKYHTQKIESISHAPPKSNESISHAPPKSNILTYSLHLPLWHQAPKLKGRTTGQALRCGDRSETEMHHPRTLNSKRSDPLSLEVEVKWSGSAQWT